MFTNNLRRIAEVAGIVSLFTMLLAFPLIRFGLPIFRTASSVRVLVGFFEILFILGISASGKLRIPVFSSRSYGHYAALLWIFWSGLSLVFADYPASSLVRQSEWYLHLLFAVALWGYISTEKKLAGDIIKVFLGGFLLYCLIFVYCWYAVVPEPELYNWATGMPGFSNIRHFGYFAMIGVILSAFYLFDTPWKRERRFLHFVLMACCWGTLIWSGSRGSIIAALFSLALLLFFISPTLRKRLLLHNTAAFVAGAFFSRFLVVNQHRFGLEYFSASMKEPTISGFSSGRTEIWLETLQPVLNHPFLGVGADGFNFIPRTKYLWLSHPHNLFLQAALDWGIIGLIFFCLLLVAVFSQFLASLRKRSDIRGEEIVSIWGFTALCMLALIDGPFYHAYSLALSACLLAIALQNSPGMKQSLSSRHSPIIMAGALFLLTAVFSLHFMILSAQLNQSIPGPENVVVKLARALPTDISYTTRWAGKWAEEYPDEAIQWLRWGRKHARFNRQAAFLLTEAEIEIRQKSWAQAKSNLEEALLFSISTELQTLIRNRLIAVDKKIPNSS
jgi:O-antigen ligase